MVYIFSIIFKLSNYCMSHFSKIQTSIHNISLLKKTLINLGFTYSDESKLLKDTSGRAHVVNLVAKSISNKVDSSLVGFYWDGQEYSLITDLDFWSSHSHFEFFLEKLKKTYSMNIILEQTVSQGFIKVNEEALVDGSIKLTVQRWV